MSLKRNFEFVLVIALWMSFPALSWSEEITDQNTSEESNLLLVGSWENKGSSCGINEDDIIVGPPSINTYNPDGTMTLTFAGDPNGCSIVIESVYTVNESSLEVENTSIKADEDCFKNKAGMNEEDISIIENVLIDRIGLGIKKVTNYILKGDILYLEDPRPYGFCEGSLLHYILERQ